MRLVPGMALIAPAGSHLRISPNLAVVLTPEPSDAKHIPSVDVTMRSAARSRPGKVAGHPAHRHGRGRRRRDGDHPRRRRASPSPRARRAAWSTACRARPSSGAARSWCSRWTRSRSCWRASARDRGQPSVDGGFDPAQVVGVAVHHRHGDDLGRVVRMELDGGGDAVRAPGPASSSDGSTTPWPARPCPPSGTCSRPARRPGRRRPSAPRPALRPHARRPLRPETSW